MRPSLKRTFIITIIIILFAAAGVSYFQAHKTQPTVENQISHEHVKFNKDTFEVYRAEKPEKGLLIYIADKTQGTQSADYAKQFASLSYYVAVIDNDTLLNSPTNGENRCLDTAKKIGDIKDQLQQHYKLDAEEYPIIVGTNQSAATVYTVLAQTKEHDFHAALAINFSPRLKAHTELCESQDFIHITNNEFRLDPVKRLPTSFYIFQDKDENSESVKFSDNIANLKLTVANDPKQNALAEAIQILQWLDPRLADQISSDASDSDLPLIEVPATESVDTASTRESLAVLLTGDGGWAEIDKSLAKILAEKGVPTVALDSLSYFWKARTPEETAKDIEATIETYLKKWNKKQVILIGYSFGADVLPFVANNLTQETQHKVSLVALLGMGKTAAFEFRLSSWMNADKNPNRLAILPELGKMMWANSICIYGIDDKDANCLPTAEFGVKTISMPGDHHFDERYDELVKHILDSEKID